jgi:hypothetical protein
MPPKFDVKSECHRDSPHGKNETTGIAKSARLRQGAFISFLLFLQ